MLAFFVWSIIFLWKFRDRQSINYLILNMDLRKGQWKNKCPLCHLRNIPYPQQSLTCLLFLNRSWYWNTVLFYFCWKIDAFSHNISIFSKINSLYNVFIINLKCDNFYTWWFKMRTVQGWWCSEYLLKYLSICLVNQECYCLTEDTEHIFFSESYGMGGSE